MLPPNKGWAVFLLWICAHAGGYIAARVNLPPLLGMLVAGIILQNIPQGEPCLQPLQDTSEEHVKYSLLKPGPSVVSISCPSNGLHAPLGISADLAWPHETAQKHYSGPRLPRHVLELEPYLLSGQQCRSCCCTTLQCKAWL